MPLEERDIWVLNFQSVHDGGLVYVNVSSMSVIPRNGPRLYYPEGLHIILFMMQSHQITGS